MDSDFLVLDSLLAVNGSFVAMQVQVVPRLLFKRVNSTKPCLSSFCRKGDSHCVMKLTYFHQYSVSTGPNHPLFGGLVVMTAIWSSLYV